MGTSGAFIAICVAALTIAGPATMASLIVVSALFQFLLAARLSLLRRIFTPVVSGTVIMLIAATVFPVVFGSMTNVPDGASTAGAPLAAGVTLVIVAGLVLRGSPRLRLWSPLIGIAAGCAVGAPLGIYDPQPILDAPWFGVPFTSWPGLDVTPDAKFWGLLPAFIIVTLVGAIETIGDGVAIQRVSRRQQRATDFRVVQGALNADGTGNLLSGLAGTLPNTTYSSSISLAEVTGIGSRRVGIIIGAIIAGVAFFPKFAAVLIAIPSAIAAAYLTVLLGLLFIQGMKIVIQDGVDHRKAVVAGVAFWVGAGLPEPVDFRRPAGRRLPLRPPGQRHDLRRHHRRHYDGLPGADLAPSPPLADAPGRRNPAQADRLPPRLRLPFPLGRRRHRPPGPGGRGNPGQPLRSRS